MSTYDNTDRTAYITLGVIFGSAIGVVAGMLMAPRSGNDTREQIRQRALEAKSRAQEQVHTTRDTAVEKLSKTLDKSHQVVDKAAQKTKDMADKTADRAHDAANQAQDEVRKTRARPTRTTDDTDNQ